MDNKILSEAGLQEGEITVYLSLLKLKEATASQITKNTGLHRSNVYDILEKLISRGLGSFVIKNNVKYFRAASPTKLLDYVKEKEEKLKQIIPSLLELSKEREDNIKVEIYKGKEGIKTVLNDMIKEGKDYLLLGQLKFEEILPIYIKQFMKIINKIGITEKAILEEGTKIIPAKYHEYRCISKEHLFPNATVVYGNKVAMFIWTDPYYIVLTTNKDIAESYKTHFNLLWKIAKK